MTILLIKGRVQMNTIVPLILLALVAISVGANAEKVEIANLVRNIYLKGKYVRIMHIPEISNNGTKSINKYLHMVSKNYVNDLFDIIAFSGSYTEFPVKKLANDLATGAAVYEISLPYSLEPNDKFSFKIVELFTNRLTPKPQKLPLSSVL